MIPSFITFDTFCHITVSKLPTGFWIQWQITCFPASLSMSGFILGENLSSKLEYTVAALIYISLITKEVQYFFHMCIGYLNFFLFQNVHSCRLFTLPLGFGPHLFTGALYILRILTRFGNCYHRLWEKRCCQHFPQFVFCVCCCFWHTSFWPNQSALSSLDSGVVWMYKKALATA